MIDSTSYHFNNNGQALRAISLIKNTNHSVFLTGKAGTGKSTLLNYIIKNTNKSMVKLAPTGIAAINIGGQTIHSFFGFALRPFLPGDRNLRYHQEVKDMCQKIETFIIDEVSMVRADLMTAIDLSLKRYMGNNQPFGGKQMLFVGDLFQLPPIVDSKNQEVCQIIDYYYNNNPFFFSAPVFKNFNLIVIELKKVYRQSDFEFVSILDKIRTGNADQNDLEIINQRCNQYKTARHYNDKKISLTPRTKSSEKINTSILESLNNPKFTFIAKTTGTFNNPKTQSRTPTYKELELCVDARVMMIANDQNKRWVNGSLGTITHVDLEGQSVQVLLDSNGEVKVESYQWDDLKYYWNAKDDKVDMESIGTFKQLPIKLAWASTIHKAQGLTLEKVVIDLGHGAFAEGQTYVALSRCKSLNGIELERKIDLSDIKVSQHALDFMTQNINVSDGLYDVFHDSYSEEGLFVLYSSKKGREVRVHLLALSLFVRDSDGISDSRESRFIDQYFDDLYGLEERTNIYNLYQDKRDQKDFNLESSTKYIKENTTYEFRRSVLYFLFKISSIDSEIVKKEVKMISTISNKLKIKEKDYRSIKALFVEIEDSSYVILKVSKNTSEKKIKKAFDDYCKKHDPSNTNTDDLVLISHSQEFYNAVKENYYKIKNDRGF
ncbi:MAG: AAA family ATPase [Flavobacteriaceae bacterium]|nr:AAA family ATPase [Flavobacteriaceae bacterium]MCY4267851.1 AAA family ATPase [Flavobacteriaceae bacterium]MCY4299280.1 AAA family ATPase [Flavobacteriaceae bacterium]